MMASHRELDRTRTKHAAATPPKKTPNQHARREPLTSSIDRKRDQARARVPRTTAQLLARQCSITHDATPHPS